MESLITILVIIALSAVSSWLSKRRQSEEPDPLEAEAQRRRAEQPPRSETALPAPATERSQETPKRRSNWEEELRRMLSGEPEQPSAPPPPPPIITRPSRTSKPAAPPQVPALPKTASEPARSALDSKKKAVEPKEVARQASRRYEEVQRRVSERARSVLDKGRDGTSVISSKAQKLQKDVADRTRQMLTKPDKEPIKVFGVSRPSGASDDVQSAVAMVRRQATARQAFVASLIFGPPKSLEQPGSTANYF